MCFNSVFVVCSVADTSLSCGSAKLSQSAEVPLKTAADTHDVP